MSSIIKRWLKLYQSNSLYITLACKMNNARDTNYFTIFFTNNWCGKWLLINEKVIIIIVLDEN